MVCADHPQYVTASIVSTSDSQLSDFGLVSLPPLLLLPPLFLLSFLALLPVTIISFVFYNNWTRPFLPPPFPSFLLLSPFSSFLLLSPPFSFLLLPPLFPPSP
jgi:hypothetical protein